MKRVISYGKQAYSGTRKINEVALTVGIEERRKYNPKTKEEYRDGEYFAVCGEVWNSKNTDIIRGGQCVDYIVNRWGKNETGRNLLALWEVFHLQQLNNIPKRFRAAIVDFVHGETDKIKLERKKCAAYKLVVTEKVTDYGTYTNGHIIIKTPDGAEELIFLSQGDEIKVNIAERAYKVINWLYDDAPNAEDIARTAKVDTNAMSYAEAKELERLEGLAEIRDAAKRIITAIDSGNVGEKWSVARMEMKHAENFLTEGV